MIIPLLDVSIKGWDIRHSDGQISFCIRQERTNRLFDNKLPDIYEVRSRSSACRGGIIGSQFDEFEGNISDILHCPGS